MRFMSGYIVTTDNDDAPKRMLRKVRVPSYRVKVSTHLYQFSWSSTPRPIPSCPAKNIRACLWVMSSLASGRSRVLSWTRNLRDHHLFDTAVIEQLTYCPVQPLVPHIIYCASCAAHDQSTGSKQNSVDQWSSDRSVQGVSCHCYRPCFGI